MGNGMLEMTTAHQATAFSSVIAKIREVFLSLSDSKIENNSHINMCDASLALQI